MFKRIWESIFRFGWPRSDKERSLVVTESLFLHIHPVKIRRHVLSFWYTLGLGWIAFVLFIILTVTGLLLMIYYIPHVQDAYQSMKDLQFAVSFGWLLRNLHRWAAHGMVIVVFLHMCRVFYTASHKKPREFNWVIGVVLLLLTLFLSFTGYLLPWDQLSYWAITVGSNIASYIPYIGGQVRYLLLGGNLIGEATLIRFYVLHCVILPFILVILVGVHFYRIRKDGGISGPPLPETPSVVEGKGEVFPASGKTYGLMALVKGETPAVEKGPEDEVFTWPHLIYRELILTLVVINILVVVSVFFNAPLEELANPHKTPNPAKAPWYFLGAQELVHYSAFWGGVVIPAAAIFYLIALPYLDKNPAGVGKWLSRKRWFAITVFTLFVIGAVTLTMIGTYFRGPNWAWVWPWQR